MKRSVLICALLSITHFLIPLKADAIRLRLANDALSVEAEHVHLQTILQRFVDLGIRVRIDPRINPRVTVSFREQDIQTGLSILLRSVNYVLIWETAPRETDSVPKLAEIQVFKPGYQSLMKKLNLETDWVFLRDPVSGALYVKDEILLRLKPWAVNDDLHRIVSDIDGAVITHNPTTGVYRIRLPENSDVSSLREKISTRREVSGAEPNYGYPLFHPVQGMAALHPSPTLSENARQPDGVPIAVLDSGLMPETGLEKFVLDQLNTLAPDETVSDVLGHGTQMAYVAAGVIKPIGIPSDAGALIPIIPIKIFDNNGYTTNFSILESIDFALRNGARVMSLSWGTATRSEFLEASLLRAESAGLIVVAAAGNQPTGKAVYPAAFGSVIGVGALAPDGMRWKDSNYGEFVTLYAPGFGTFPVGYKGEPGAYAGTSISAAFTANVIADYLTRNPSATKKDVLNAIAAGDRSQETN